MLSSPLRFRLFLLAAAMAIVACGLGAYQAAWHVGLATSGAKADERAGLYASTVDQVIDRYRYLPDLLARDPRVLAMLADPTDRERIETANAYLAETASAAGAADLFVMDPTGLTLAASNHDKPLSFVGKNYGFRPYFNDALRTGAGRFYAIGVTTGEPGYFLARRIGPAHAPLGVSVVKIALTDLEREWKAGGETVLLADGHGVVFLASHPAWLYRPVKALSAESLIQLSVSEQYAGADLAREPLLTGDSAVLPRTITLNDPEGRGPARLIATRHLGAYGWDLFVLAETQAIAHQSQLGGIIGGLGALAFLLAGFAWRSRRQAVRAMKRSHDELEALVLVRTRDLFEANARLQGEISHRRAAEESLRRTQDDLVQASKLSALGHLSAAIAHEINQPLSALRTYVASTSRMLREGRHGLAETNLARIGDLVTRMATITGDLKLLARKDPGKLHPVDLVASLERVLGLMEPRMRALEVRLSFDPPPHVPNVCASAPRLDQVILNLVTNALDAMTDKPRRELTFLIEVGSEYVALVCEDSGGGIPPEYRASLFDPFFTTKEVGEGTGLGLSISQAIVEGFGGALMVEHRGSGAAFIVRLQRAEADAVRVALEAAQ